MYWLEFIKNISSRLSMLRYKLSQYRENNVSDSQIAQLVKHLPCKREVPGSSPGLTAHFSHPVTFGAQRGTVHTSLVSVKKTHCSKNLPLKFENKFQISGVV